MKKLSVLVAAALVVGAACFGFKLLDGSTSGEGGRLPARAISIPCETEDLAFDILRMDRPKGDSRWVHSLNGKWDFKWKRSSATPDWEKSTQVDVPGCW